MLRDHSLDLRPSQAPYPSSHNFKNSPPLPLSRPVITMNRIIFSYAHHDTLYPLLK